MHRTNTDQELQHRCPARSGTAARSRPEPSCSSTETATPAGSADTAAPPAHAPSTTSTPSPPTPTSSTNPPTGASPTSPAPAHPPDANTPAATAPATRAGRPSPGPHPPPETGNHKCLTTRPRPHSGPRFLSPRAIFGAAVPPLLSLPGSAGRGTRRSRSGGVRIVKRHAWLRRSNWVPAYRASVGGAAKTSTGSGPVVLGSGRPGPVRSALLRALEEARVARRMSTEHELRAVLAVRIAHAADRAAAAGDAAGLLRASDKLLELLDTLPVRAEAPRGGGAGDGSGGERGRVLSILDGEPTVGDAADA